MDADGTLAVLRRAIENEVAGQRFYGDAAFLCIDPWAKELFAALAQEEDRHTHLLLVEYESLRAQRGWIDYRIATGITTSLDLGSLTFPEDLAGPDVFGVIPPAAESIDRRSDDLSALAVGIGMETSAIELYGRELSQCGDPNARAAYQFLVDEETRHLLQLTSQWEQLAGVPFG